MDPNHKSAWEPIQNDRCWNSTSRTIHVLHGTVCQIFITDRVCQLEADCRVSGHKIRLVVGDSWQDALFGRDDRRWRVIGAFRPVLCSLPPAITITEEFITKSRLMRNSSTGKQWADDGGGRAGGANCQLPTPTRARRRSNRNISNYPTREVSGKDRGKSFLVSRVEIVIID